MVEEENNGSTASNDAAVSKGVCPFHHAAPTATATASSAVGGLAVTVEVSVAALAAADGASADREDDAAVQGEINDSESGDTDVATVDIDAAFDATYTATNAHNVLERHGDEHDSELNHPMAKAFSNYSAPLQPDHQGTRHSVSLYRVPRGQAWPTEEDDAVIPLAQHAHDQMRAHILGDYFPCVGARAAFTHNTYRFGFYKDLGHHTSVAAMGVDLARFTCEYKKLGDFTTFVAMFKYPQSTSEDGFETRMWKHLQLLHNMETGEWDPAYSANPEDPNFAFSFNGCAFFVVGMHSGASRFSRRLGYPALIFNPESQIHNLKEHNQLHRFAVSVRNRDKRFQGSVNPSLPADVDSTGGEHRVYSGKEHKPGSEWVCPFKPRADLLNK